MQHQSLRRCRFKLEGQNNVRNLDCKITVWQNLMWSQIDEAETLVKLNLAVAHKSGLTESIGITTPVHSDAYSRIILIFFVNGKNRALTLQLR